MVEAILKQVAPHHCLGCGDIGSVLCRCCQNYINDEPFNACLVCGVSAGTSGLCNSHALPYSRAWCVSERKGTMLEVIDGYKFKGMRAACVDLAAILDSSLPEMPAETILCPVPTAPKNIRIRGYDHMLLVAKEFGKLRGLKLSKVLVRKSNATQHFAKTAKERRKQAEGFFEIKKQLITDVPYLILDDIFTTGSTVRAAASELRAHGAADVWVAVISKQV